MPLPRLYAILDVDLLRARGLEPLAVAGAWVDAGVRLIQLRAKHLSFGPMLELADELSTVARSAGARAVVNDRVDVARLAGAAGVHLGQTDLRPAEGRSLLGPNAIVGLSTHTPAQVEAACREPIGYVAIGPVYATTTKSGAEPIVGVEGVAAAAALAQRANLPLVAIGGITLERAAAVIAAGADSVAVISDLVSAAPGVRARQFLQALT